VRGWLFVVTGHGLASGRPRHGLSDGTPPRAPADPRDRVRGQSDTGAARYVPAVGSRIPAPCRIPTVTVPAHSDAAASGARRPASCRVPVTGAGARGMPRGQRRQRCPQTRSMPGTRDGAGVRRCRRRRASAARRPRSAAGRVRVLPVRPG
jgi:hypothetical protein